jgi:hypothetical protein
MKRSFELDSSSSGCSLENSFIIKQTHLFSSSDEIKAIDYFNELKIANYKDLLNIQ